MRNRSIVTILAGLLVSLNVAAEKLLRDPTQPPLPAAIVAKSKPSFVVNAIIVSKNRKLAIVNGKRVTVGADIDGATIVSISKRRLVLDVDGEHLTLDVQGRPVRQ